MLHPSEKHSYFWTLDSDKNPMPCDSVEEWSEWLGKSGRLVGSDCIGTIKINTMATGINCQKMEGQPPLIFETWVIDSDKGAIERCYYATWSEALEGHHLAVFYYRLQRKEEH